MWCRTRALAFVWPSGARAGHRMRGKPPGVAITLQRRLEILNAKDPFYEQKIDIGFPFFRTPRSKERLKRAEHLAAITSDPNLEKLARTHQLKVDLEKVEEDWSKLNKPQHICKIAKHYDIYKHLYDEGYFVPRVNLNVAYDIGDDLLSPVYHGNVIKPTEAKLTPFVSYDCDDDSLWTLTFVNLDGHLTEPGKEYMHWCVSNIPKDQIENGDTLVKYMQPIPPKGTGYHRYVFVLYKQTEKVDFDITRVNDDSLTNRTFVTRDWYSKYQDIITPAGLAFFQSDWDENITDFYHKHLNMKEPVYEYDFPPHYIKPQVHFPLKEAFDRYMERYKDPKDVNKEYFVRKLKDEHPFRKPNPPLKYPCAHVFPKDMPSWLKARERKIRLNQGRWSDY